MSAASSWLGPRSVDGGLDEVPLHTTNGRLWLGGKGRLRLGGKGRLRLGGKGRLRLGGKGRLWLCGKHVPGPDPEAALRRASDASAIVCLCERHELEQRYPEYVTWLEHEEGRRAHWFEIPDLHAPDMAQARQLVARLTARLDQDDGLVVHCGAGIGRAPTIAICTLIAIGHTRESALELVAERRPMAGPESGRQQALVDAFTP